MFGFTRIKPLEHPSANYNERSQKVDTIVLHYTAADLKPSLDHLCDPKGTNRVSAHYVVDRDGTVYRLVPEAKRAWHAGYSKWKGRKDLNSSSVGIEIINLGAEPYPDEQIEAVIKLCLDIQDRHDIRHVVGHSDIAVGRKIDPGPQFPWKRLAKAGVGVWTDDLHHPQPDVPAHELLAKIGYDTTNLPLALKAFQRHYYPDGLTPSGLRTNERLTAVAKLF